MSSTRRWWVVAVVAVLLVAVPAAWRSLPVPDDDVGAARVLDLVRSSDDRSWSGFVETDGAVQLPSADDFSDIGRLLGERTRLRAWWQGDDRWRVDEVLASGERGLRHDGDRLTTWDYERGRATFSRDPGIRLPRSSDLLPPVLGRRLVGGVADADVSRLPDERIAGRTALGLRVDAPSGLSSIDHVDLWAESVTGVPLRVEVVALGDDDPSFVTEFVDFDPDRPADTVVGIDPGERVEVDYDEVLDIADAVDQYAPLRPPASVVGLEQQASSDRAVGVYGLGTTQVVAIPLRDREAEPLREQLRATPGASLSPDRTGVSAGPLSVVLTGRDGGGWLLAGTLTPEATSRAATDVLDGYVFLEDG